MKKFKRGISLSLIITLVLTLLPIDIAMGEVSRAGNRIHIESTYPTNNREDVEVNPLIKFVFKEKIELVDKKKIKISSDANEFAVDINKDAFLSFEENVLKIDINSENRGGKFNLRENTAYKVTLEKGAIRLKNEKNNSGQVIFNEEESLYFITGIDAKPANRGLVVEKYSSNTQGTDKINYIDSTQLDVDGNIYLHFNKNIQWNKYETEVKTDKQALKYFRLYKRPKEFEKGKSYKYDINKRPVPSTDEDIKIENVEIVKDNNNENTNILKISPKDDLVNLNEYVIRMNKRDILISFEDDRLNYNIDQSIWTKASNDKARPNWDRDSSAEEIIEYENAPNVDSLNKKGYVIHGAPKYDKNNPITILVDKEVVLKPYEGYRSPLSDIELYENYTGSIKHENIEDIESYKVEYYMENGIKKTKLLFYPKNQLGAGKEYKLEIKEGTFVTRGNMPLEGIDLRFVIEGDHNEEKGIYGISITVDGIKQTNEIFDDYLYFDGDIIHGDKDEEKEDDEKKEKERMHEIGFEIEGYNFTEEIERIELIKVEDYKIDEEDEGQKRFYRQELQKEGLGSNPEEEKPEYQKNQRYPEHPEYPKYPENPEYPEKPERPNKYPDKPSYESEVAIPKIIEIPTKDVKTGSGNKITGIFDENTLKELSKASSLGEYEVIISFKYPNKKSRGIGYASSNGNPGSKLSNKLRDCMKDPKYVGRYPYEDEDEVVNYNDLDKVTISYRDDYRDVTSRLSEANGGTKKIEEFKVTELGRNENLIMKKTDGTNKVRSIQRERSKEIKFELYLDTSKLEKNKTYQVTVPKDAVRCKFNYEPHHNERETWTFTTTNKSEANKVYKHSVPENYDASYPLMIGGKNLESGLTVTFKNVSTGKRYSTDRVVEYIKDEEDNKIDKILVYLPKKDKLPIGLYDIIIYDDEGQENKLSDGVLSVVENGKYVPNEDYREKDTTIDDTKIEYSLKEIIKTSKNELELLSKYTGKTLNLDSIIGEEVLTRDIKHDGSHISTLNTVSKWSNIKLTDIKRNSSKEPMTIRLGRAEPQVRDNLNKRLRGENIKSEFIIVGGENYSAKGLSLNIPYKQSNGKNLKVLRYDEETRKINKINVYDRDIDRGDKQVKIDLVSALPSDGVTKGIFVVIEE